MRFKVYEPILIVGPDKFGTETLLARGSEKKKKKC